MFMIVIIVLIFSILRFVLCFWFYVRQFRTCHHFIILRMSIIVTSSSFSIFSFIYIIFISFISCCILIISSHLHFSACSPFSELFSISCFRFMVIMFFVVSTVIILSMFRMCHLCHHFITFINFQSLRDLHYVLH